MLAFQEQKLHPKQTMQTSLPSPHLFGRRATPATPSWHFDLRLLFRRVTGSSSGSSSSGSRSSNSCTGKAKRISQRLVRASPASGSMLCEVCRSLSTTRRTLLASGKRSNTWLRGFNSLSANHYLVSGIKNSQVATKI